LTSSTNVWTQQTVNYAPTADTLGTFSIVTEGTTVDNPTSSASNFVNDTTNDYTNYVIDNLDAVTLSIEPSVAFSHSLDLSCSLNVDSTLSFAKGQHESNELPSWIDVDSSTGDISGTAPSSAGGSTIMFALEISSNSYSDSKPKVITIIIEGESNNSDESASVEESGSIDESTLA